MSITTVNRRDPSTNAIRQWLADLTAGVITQGVFLADVSDIHYRSTTAEDGAVIHANPGTLHYLDVSLAASVADDRWLHAFDSTTVPANGTAPKFSWVIPSKAAGERLQLVIESTVGLRFDTGISVALSSTEGTLTQTVGTEGRFQAQGKSRA